MTKKWWQSKILWAQIITIVLGGLASIQSVVPAPWGVFIVLALDGVLTAVLRVFFTDTKIG